MITKLWTDDLPEKVKGKRHYTKHQSVTPISLPNNNQFQDENKQIKNLPNHHDEILPISIPSF